MKRKTFKINRITAVMLLATFFTFAFVWTNSSASEQSNSGVKNQNTTAEIETQKLVTDSRAQGSGSLKRFGDFKVAADRQAEAAGNPRVAVAADFDSDGVIDLLVAHNDQLVFHRGNINAFAPQTEEAWEAIHDGRFVSPFERKTRSTSVPAAADFLFSGDFNRDGKLDAAFAARGDNVLYVLEGDGAGNFPNLRRIETAGAITALAAGDVNRADGLPDIIVGTSGADGFGLQIFSGLGDIFAAASLQYNFPSQAQAIAVGQLDENDFNDIAVATDSGIIILSGAEADESGAMPSAEMRTLPQSSNIKSLVVGDFLPDRDNRAELVALSADGNVRIFARGSLDTRPVSINEHLAEQVREYQSKGYPVPKRILARLSKEDLRKPLARPKDDATTWAEAETVTTAAPNLQLSAQAILTTGHLSGGATDDLIVLDQNANKVLILPFQPDYSGLDQQNTYRGFDGWRAVQSFETDGSPVAALAMKLDYDNSEDLLVLKEGGESSAFISAPQVNPIFTVTTAVDNIDSNPGDGVCSGPSGCTLRAAIMEANKLAGDDTIMINAGINPTISRGQPDNDAQGTNDETTGDLDITCAIANPASDGCAPLAASSNNLSIIGAAGGNTVSAGTFTAYPVNGGGSINTDRVFDVGQDGIFGGGFGGSTGVKATFTNLTIQNGNVREAVNTMLGGGNYAFGGGIRYDGFGNNNTHGTLTLTNTTINNNQGDNAGGGVYQIYGTHSASGSTYSNNITNAGEGGGLFFGAATSNSNVSITNSTFNANTAKQGTVFGTFTANADGGGIRFSTDLNTLTISNTNFTNNVAQQDGGAIKTLNGAATVTGGTMTGNTARRHGGVNYGDQDTAGGARFLTFSGSTMQNNLANSDNTIFAGDGSAGDGGAIFRDRGVLNITNCVIGGTSAGQQNTATNGGGVAHDFTVDSAAGNTSNQTTVTINGGSINGNIANTDGGGVYFNAALFDVTASILNIGQTTATTLTGNKAKNNGGGINVSNAATANLKNMTLLSNQANSDNSGGGDGGALYQNTGTTNFTGTLTVGGSGTANSAVNGGGIRNNAGTVNIPSGASITFNTATGTGGGISNVGTLSALATPTITNNTATGNGGGIFNSGTLGAITTPALNSNSAANGGGIYTSNGILTVTNGTINSNSVTSGAAGGGILYAGSGASTVTGATVNNNGGSGIYITANALDITNTTITGSANDGISVTGTGTGSELINGNIISGNGSLGIDLGDNGVTANDAAGDADTGPNNLQNYPVINYVRRGDGIGNATLNSTASRTFRINYFANTACDSSGFGEGEVSLGTQNVTTNASGTITFTTIALAFGAREQITATATDLTTGDTSEFSQCRQVNRLPTFGTAQTISRQQGTLTGNNGLIATVADLDQAANTLAVTVNGGATATVNGVTVSGIAIDASGNVTANVSASCAPSSNATFTLRVTDTPGEFNEQTLTVNVTANTAPTVGNYANTTVNAGSNVTVTPDAAPTDNGSIASVTAVATTPAGFTGTFSGNTTTGAVTITNAAPFGVYTITVTTADNCGLSTPKTFTLTVNAIPTITPQAGVSRQQGSPSSTSQIAAVNDADQTANTLVVTIRAVGGAAPGIGTATVNGVTVSNIVVSAAGVVTADIVAACGATTPANFTLRVTDSNGAFSEATLSVAVTANTAPTVGTYSNTTLPLGGGTTVTPTSAPADNGSVVTATAAAPGFTGTLAVSATTGVVTITNANSAGAFTVTVTFTDNCTAPTTRTFTLTVVAPPTIAKSFSPTSAFINGISTLTITITNPAANTVALTGVGVTDPFPTGLEVDATPGATNSCSTGTFTPAAAATSISVSGATIPVNTACTFSVKVKGTTPGAKLNTTGNVTSTNGGNGGTASATLTVNTLEADVDPPPSGNGLVQSSDVVQTRLFLNCTGIPNAMTDEFQRADSSPFDASTNTYGDGKIQSDDVVQARRYQNLTDAPRAAAGPTGPVVPRCGQPAAPLQAGKQSEQLSNTVEETALAPQLVAAPEGVLRQLRVQNATAGSPSQVTVSILADAAGDEAGYGFTINYVTSILTNPVVAIGTAGGVQSCNTTTSPGQIFCGVDNFPTNRTGDPLIGEIATGTSQVLITVTFTVPSGVTPQTTPVTLTDVNASRDTPPLLLSIGSQDGTVTITGPTAATITIGGRVLTSSGRGISGAQLTLTDANGQSRTTTSTSFGYYQFEDVEVGVTYILSASGKHMTFSQPMQVLNINEANDQINFTADVEKRVRSF